MTLAYSAVPHAAAKPAYPLTAEDLRGAFEAFSQATNSFSNTYAALQLRLAELDVQLAATNAELERNLAEKERVTNCLEAVMAALPIGVIVVDLEGRVVTINNAVREMLNLRETQAVGRRLDQVLDGIKEARTMFRSLGGDFLRGQTVEITVNSSEGVPRILEVVLLAADAQRRHEFGGVLVFHDVTELKRLEQRSATVSRLTAMGEMAMNVAHEIRNPLGSIELFASALARDLEDRPHQKQLAQFISAGVRSIESIVENILQFNRPRTLCREPLMLHEVIGEALRYARHLFEQRAIEVAWLVDDADVCVEGDAQLLKQVFLNLAMNAGQAMDRGGRLEISIHCTATRITVRFSDNGPGIPAGLLPKIFDPFVTTKPKGTGLGLTIVHNIITAHEGTIEIGNRPTGGACVTIELPRAAASVAPSQNPALLCEESYA